MEATRQSRLLIEENIFGKITMYLSREINESCDAYSLHTSNMEHFYVFLQSTIQQSGEPLKVHEDSKKHCQP